DGAASLRRRSDGATAIAARTLPPYRLPHRGAINTTTASMPCHLVHLACIYYSHLAVGKVALAKYIRTALNPECKKFGTDFRVLLDAYIPLQNEWLIGSSCLTTPAGSRAPVGKFDTRMAIYPATTMCTCRTHTTVCRKLLIPL